MPANILLIDDNPSHLDVLEGFLSTRSVSIRRETDGHEALKKLEQPPYPDLIVLDFMMPMASGSMIYEKIRRHPALNETPVIVLSAINPSTVQAQIPKSRFTQFVSKPVDFTIFEAALRSLLGPKYSK